MNDKNEELIPLLSGHRPDVPPSLVGCVMASLPERSRRFRLSALLDFWESRRRWAVPALAGAFAALLLAVGLWAFEAHRSNRSVTVTFALRAPDAERVELVGTFNDWRSGEIVLKGPDASGMWSASVELPSGRHEYLFLVDGKDWVTDPAAMLWRPDGFGRDNAVIEVVETGDAG